MRPTPTPTPSPPDVRTDRQPNMNGCGYASIREYYTSSETKPSLSQIQSQYGSLKKAYPVFNTNDCDCKTYSYI